MKLNSILIPIFFLFVSLACKSRTDLEPFNIQVVKTEKEIKLKCSEGCAWTELKFTKNNYQPQIIDEFGMNNSTDKQSEQIDENLTNFSFSIFKTEKGIQLKGIEGTAWEELQFNLINDKPQLINQMGMK